jgi:hypothetical protein
VENEHELLHPERAFDDESVRETQELYTSVVPPGMSRGPTFHAPLTERGNSPVRRFMKSQSDEMSSSAVRSTVTACAGFLVRSDSRDRRASYRGDDRLRAPGQTIRLILNGTERNVVFPSAIGGADQLISNGWRTSVAGRRADAIARTGRMAATSMHRCR